MLRGYACDADFEGLPRPPLRPLRIDDCPVQEPEPEPQASNSPSHRLTPRILERPVWFEDSYRDPRTKRGVVKYRTGGIS